MLDNYDSLFLLNIENNTITVVNKKYQDLATITVDEYRRRMNFSEEIPIRIVDIAADYEHLYVLDDVNCYVIVYDLLFCYKDSIKIPEIIAESPRKCHLVTTGKYLIVVCNDLLCALTIDGRFILKRKIAAMSLPGDHIIAALDEKRILFKIGSSSSMVVYDIIESDMLPARLEFHSMLPCIKELHGQSNASFIKSETYLHSIILSEGVKCIRMSISGINEALEKNSRKNSNVVDDQ